jgi:hypothetical protein
MEEHSAVGKWIQVVDHLFITGFVGFITGCDEAKNKFQVILTKDDQGRPFFDTNDFLIAASQLELLEESLDENCLLTMIDMALETKDEQWFKELTSTGVPYGTHPALTKR